MSHVKITHQKSIFKAKLFEVKEDTVTLPTGEKHKHQNIYKKSAVSVFPVSSENEIYLIEEYRYLYSTKIIDAIAGYVDKGESTLQAARRELKEEVGITAGHWEEIARIDVAASVIKGQQHLFLAKDLDFGQAKREAMEEISVLKMTLDEAVQMVINGKITNASAVIGILLIEKLQKRKIL